MKFLIVLVLALATVNAARLDNLLKPAIASGRIINGQVAAKGEAPYIISLQSTGFLGGHFCAGSLIHPNYVATAAHCLTAKSIDVVAGLHNRSDKSDVQVRRVTAQQYRQHEQYGGGVGPFDIGLIYIPEAFDLNDLRDASAPVTTISLPSGKYAQTGRGKLYGWGRDETATSPQVLQTLDADIIGFTECQRQLPSDTPLDERTNICTHTVGKIDGACNGDSGGPLIINTASGPELVGIVSWGYSPCHWSTYPSVYTAVSGFHQWIDDTADQLAAA